MKVLVGVESTAHTFGVGVIDALSGEILANEKDSYVTAEGGMVPMEVRAHHKAVSDEVWSRALDGIRNKEKGKGAVEVVAIAFSNAPGLAPCLLEGMAFVKRRAKELGIPVILVNHCVAHLVVGEKFGARDPVMLYVSGANTQVIAFEGERFRVFGETLDLGVGNFIDTIGRSMGLGFPAGPKIEKLAQRYKEKGKGNKDELLELPYSVKGMDISLSGIQTKIRNFIKAPSFRKRGSLESENLDGRRVESSRVEKGEDYGKLAYALQETVFAMLVEVAERALAHTGKEELLLGGGVACNSRLVEMCSLMCQERGVKLIVPSRDLLVDNGAMIGYLGFRIWKSVVGSRLSESDLGQRGVFWDLDLIDVAPRERTDEVCVRW